jgi:hypothetical protein
MQLDKAPFALVVWAAFCTQTAQAQGKFGAQGAETGPNRMQQWLVPSPDPDIAAHALLYRPAGDGPFRLAVIAHASTQNVVRRAQMPQPEYRALAASGTEGHWLGETEAGVKIAGGELDRALKALAPAAAKKR